MKRRHFLLMILGLALSACQAGGEGQPPATTMVVEIYDAQKNLLQSISDADKVKAIEAALAARKPIVFKKMPEFPYRIVLANKTERWIWWYSPYGYVHNPHGKDTSVFQIDRAGLPTSGVVQ